jgi:Zn-dependent protease with chaperone function
MSEQEAQKRYISLVRRMDEYLADSFAKRFTGAKVFAESLVAVNTRGRYLNEEFWPGIEQAAKTQGNVAVITTLGRTFQQGLPPEAQQKWLTAALREQTDFDDTHPCLAERLKALGITGPSPLPTYVPETAAAHYLGETAEKITGALDQLFATAPCT